MKCSNCEKEIPAGTEKKCMHHQMHYYVCSSKCMNEFYNPPKSKEEPKIQSASPTNTKMSKLQSEIKEVLLYKTKTEHEKLSIIGELCETTPEKSVIEDIVVDLQNYIDSCNGPYILVSVEDLKSWVSMLL